MKDGFVRVAAATPKVKVADPEWNRRQMEDIIESCRKEGVKLLVFPELGLTAYTCGDLFLQFPLLRKAREELKNLAEAAKDSGMLKVGAKRS